MAVRVAAPGHRVVNNGLTTAAYLGAAGLSVLVVERSATVGGTAVTEQIATLLPAGRKIRWNPPEQQHFTLAFLGEQPDNRLAEIIAALTEVPLQRFTLSCKGVGWFRSGVMDFIKAVVSSGPSTLVSRLRMWPWRRITGGRPTVRCRSLPFCLMTVSRRRSI